MSKEQSEENRAFWEAFCIESHPRLICYGCALTNGDVAAANDLTQAAILRVLQYAPDPAPIVNHLAYLNRILRNIWIDSRRPRETSLEDLLETDPNNPALIDSPDIAAILEDREQLEQKVGPLNPELVVTLVMRLEGFGFEAIAAVLKENVSKTKFRWYTFLKRLHKRIKREKENGRD